MNKKANESGTAIVKASPAQAPPAQKKEGAGKSKTYQYTPPKDHGHLRTKDGNLWGITKYATESLLANGVTPTGYSVEGEDTLPFWDVDPGGEVYTQRTKRVNSCVYDATKKYIEALALGTFTLGDKDFFVDHPRVNTDGVDRANVLGVVQGLLIPWGLGIDHVWVPSLSAIGDQEREFLEALGCNPMALLDANTSNSQFIENMELDPHGPAAQKIRDEYRFEFTEKPGAPSVAMITHGAKVTTNVGGAWSSTSYGMGHAEFIGPRDRLAATWHIAFSVARLRNIEYKNGHDLFKYEALETFADEILIQNKRYRDLSVWQSLVGGKKLTSYDKKPITSPDKKDTKKDDGNGRDNLQRTKDGVYYIAGPGGVEYYDWIDPNTPTAREKELGPCPVCGKQLDEISGIQYCLSCDWYYDSEEEDDTGLDPCPFCGGVIAFGKCTKCDFDDLEWMPSSYFKCENHDEYMLTYTATRQYGIYACPVCLAEEPAPCEDFVNRIASHNDRKMIAYDVEIQDALDGGESK